VRVGPENPILDSGLDGVVVCGVRTLKGPDNEGCRVQRDVYEGCRFLHPEVEKDRGLGQIVQASLIP
jgi:hypothetical protein